jgi:AcrR family transcriptional regulator
MFHYHFRTKDNFIQAVLQRLYEEMFAELVLQVQPDTPALTSLRNLLRMLARFARKHRTLMMTLVSEAMAGERLAADFLKRNVPRHLKLIGDVIRHGQRERTIVNAPPPQLIAYIVGAVAGPLLVGSALQQHKLVPASVSASLNAHVLSERALDQRIDMVLRGLRPPDEKEEQ